MAPVHIRALILVALIAVLVVLCFFKYKQVQNEKAQAGIGGDDQMAEALRLEELKRDRELYEPLPECEMVVFENAFSRTVSFVFTNDKQLASCDAKAANAYGSATDAVLTPSTEGTGPVGTRWGQSVLYINLAMPTWAGYGSGALF